MKCQYCHKDIPDRGDFCPYCGKRKTTKTAPSLSPATSLSPTANDDLTTDRNPERRTSSRASSISTTGHSANLPTNPGKTPEENRTTRHGRNRGGFSTVLLVVGLVAVLGIGLLFFRGIGGGDESEMNQDDVQGVAGSSAEQSGAIEGEGYYWDNSQKVVSVIDAKKSKDNPSESEVMKLLEKRGFTDCPITYEYDLDGNYYEETEVTDDSPEKHPMYLAYYSANNGDVWTVHVINGKVFAYPASYNLDSNLSTEVIVSESSEITSYDNETNMFYITVPKEETVDVIIVDRIDTKTLDTMTAEVIRNYED